MKKHETDTVKNQETVVVKNHDAKTVNPYHNHVTNSAVHEIRNALKNSGVTLEGRDSDFKDSVAKQANVDHKAHGGKVMR